MSLKQLQEIRERRLDKQIKEVQIVKNALFTAEQNLEECRLKLQQFHQWRLEQQEGLFKGLQGRSCTPQGMFEYRAKIEKLSQEEELLKANIVKAEDQLQVTQKKYDNAKAIANQLALKNEKTKEIVDIQEKADSAIQLAKDP